MEENNNVMNNKKNAIVGLVAVVVVVLVVVLGASLFLPSPKKVIKKYCKYMNDGDFDKVIDLMDFEGVAVFSKLDEEDYEDFDDELKDFKDSDDYEEFEDELEDGKDEMVDILESSFEYYDEFEMELKEVKSSKKVKGTKSLYKVKAKVKVKAEYDGEEESDTSTMTFYMRKKGLNYYIVGSEGSSLGL